MLILILIPFFVAKSRFWIVHFNFNRRPNISRIWFCCYCQSFLCLKIDKAFFLLEFSFFASKMADYVIINDSFSLLDKHLTRFAVFLFLSPFVFLEYWAFIRLIDSLQVLAFAFNILLFMNFSIGDNVSWIVFSYCLLNTSLWTENSCGVPDSKIIFFESNRSL